MGLVIAHGKKEGIVYVTSGSNGTISITSSKVGTITWHRRLGHMSKKGIKVLLSNGKLPRLKSIDLNLCEDCIFRK